VFDDFIRDESFADVDIVDLVGAYGAVDTDSLEVRFYVYDPVLGQSGIDNLQTRIVIDDVTLTRVPEPATLLLMVFGLAGLGLLTRRYRSRGPIGV